MNPSILGKAIELDAARAHFVTTSLAAWLFLRYRSDKKRGQEKIRAKKKAAQRAAYKEAREGRKSQGRRCKMTRSKLAPGHSSRKSRKSRKRVEVI
jgi:hypothetical protein